MADICDFFLGGDSQNYFMGDLDCQFNTEELMLDLL